MDSQCQSKKVIIIYHRADYDGLFSGNIARKFYQECYHKIYMKGYNYGDKLPDFDKIISEYDEICILDVSFDVDIMKKLKESKKVYWIDHHIGTILQSEENGYSDIPGSRTKEKIAACEEAWKYFFSNLKIPHIIELLSAYDVWDHDRFDWDTEITPIQYSLRAKYSLNIEKIWRDWEKLVGDLDYLNSLLDLGNGIMKYQKAVWRSWCGNYAFDITVAGKYRAICMLTAQSGSLQFESILGDPENKGIYDLQVVVNRKGPDLYNISIYKESDECNDFDCAEYASKVYKTGNGHKSAAGFTINFEQFAKLMQEQIL